MIARVMTLVSFILCISAFAVDAMWFADKDKMFKKDIVSIILFCVASFSCILTLVFWLYGV